VNERVHAVETAQAVQAATEAGLEAPRASSRRAATTDAIAHAGAVVMVAAGSVALIVGMFLGLTIRASK
jgi:hypothetical protein